MNRIARTAGLLYLIVIATGMFSLGYVPAELGLHGEAAAVIQRLSHSQLLFRLGIASGLACNVAFLLLPLALYRLLAPTGKEAATAMVALAAASVPIAFVDTFHQLDLLTLVDGARSLAAWTSDQRQAQVMLQLAGYRHGLLVLEILWGLWLLPLGYLVFKCGFLPRALGVLLMLGCLGYLADFLGTLLLPAYTASALADYMTLPAALGEIGTALWLFLAGHRLKPARAAVA